MTKPKDREERFRESRDDTVRKPEPKPEREKTHDSDRSDRGRVQNDVVNTRPPLPDRDDDKKR